jgi:hypothetical protein
VVNTVGWGFRNSKDAAGDAVKNEIMDGLRVYVIVDRDFAPRRRGVSKSKWRYVLHYDSVELQNDNVGTFCTTKSGT